MRGVLFSGVPGKTARGRLKYIKAVVRRPLNLSHSNLSPPLHLFCMLAIVY